MSSHEVLAKRARWRLWGGLLLLSMALASRAEDRRFGDYVVHYSLFQSSFLQPSIAHAYAIVRARDRAVLTIAVRRDSEQPAGEAVGATISGTRGDLIYSRALDLREIREEQAIYYLADFEFISGEAIYFELSIRPDGEPGTLSLQFNQTLYADR